MSRTRYLNFEIYKLPTTLESWKLFSGRFIKAAIMAHTPCITE